MTLFDTTSTRHPVIKTMLGAGLLVGVLTIDASPPAVDRDAMAPPAKDSTAGQPTDAPCHLNCRMTGIAKPRLDDATLKRRVERLLWWRPRTDGLDIDVIVDDGAVTLRGSVSSSIERDVAGTTAAEVPGARAVLVDLTSGHEASAPVTYRAVDVQLALTHNPYVDPRRVELEIVDDDIYARGDVPHWRSYRIVRERLEDVGARTVDVVPRHGLRLTPAPIAGPTLQVGLLEAPRRFSPYTEIAPWLADGHAA